MALTNPFVRGLQHTDRDQTYYDTQHGPGRRADPVAGFGIRLRPAGEKKVWVLRYRPLHAAQPRLITLGEFPGMLVDEARDAARAAKVAAKKGQDPLELRRAERDAVRQAMTLRKLAALYLDEHVATTRSAGPTRRRAARLLPLLGAGKKAGDLTPDDVRRLHTKLTKEAGPTEANRCVGLLRGMWNWAVDAGHLPATVPNPAARVKRNPEPPRDRWARGTELPDLLAAIDACPNAHIRAFLNLLLLTGCRRNELLAVRWRDVDLHDCTLHLRETKNGRPRDVYLSAPAVAELRALGLGMPGAYVFPGRTPGKPLNNPNRAWDAVRARLWLAQHPAQARRLRTRARADVERRSKHASRRPEAVETRVLRLAADAMKADDAGVLRLHDLRRTVAAMMATSGETELVIAAVLGHTVQGVTAVYAHVAPTAVRDALDRHGERVQAARQLAAASADTA